MQFITIILILITVSFSALAVEDTAPQCKSDGNQLEMNACAIRDYKTSDSNLNVKYQEIMSQLSASEQKALRLKQRKWLKQRDPKCKLEAKESEGGSIWTVIFMGCLQTVTEQRTKELETWQNK